MGERYQNEHSAFLLRQIRSMDKMVITTTSTVMVLFIFLIRRLNYMDLCILNLVHSMDVFMEKKDWREGGLYTLFGLMYLMATFEFSMHASIPWVSAVVVAWTASCCCLGYPFVSWIFFPCLMMWILKLLYRRAPDAIVVTGIIQTLANFVKSENKSTADFIFVVSFIFLHLAFFAIERDAICYLCISYVLSFAWMWLKSPIDIGSNTDQS